METDQAEIVENNVVFITDYLRNKTRVDISLDENLNEAVSLNEENDSIFDIARSIIDW